MNHKLHQTKISTTNIVILMFFALMFLSTFNSLLPSLKMVGFLSVFSLLTIATFLFIYFIFTKEEIHKVHLNISIPFFMLLLTMFIGTYINRSTESFQYIFQFATIISFFMFSSLIKWDAHKIRLAKRLSIIFLVTLPFITNISLIGAYMILPIFFVLLHKRKSIINFVFLAASIYLIYLAGMRAVFILLAASVFTYIFWKLISKTKLRMSMFFISLMSILISFVFIYPKLIYWSKFPIIEGYVYQYTGKSLMSGRNRLWDDLTYIINTKPFLGHGTGVLPADVMPTFLSSHNLYLQTALQNGWIGLSLLLVLFFVIWLGYFRSKNLYSTRLSASFFVGILVYQSFEVVLTQNKMDTAFIFWLIISVGISNSIYKKQPI